MALRGDCALAILERIGDDNAKREFYLTDAVEVARKMGLPTVALETEEDEVRGVNTQGQLAEAEGVLQRRLRAAHHEAGVSMTAPETVYFAPTPSSGATSSSSPTWCSAPASRSTTAR